MASSIQRRRGTTSDHATFTGAVGEITIDTTKDTVVVHDGAGVGGVPLLREDLGNLPAGAVGDAKLATIATAGKVSNSATTATNANTASAIVARDASGNFTAGTITAGLTGAASSNVLKAGDTMTGALVVPLGAVGAPSLTFTGDLNTGIFSPGADQLAISTNGTQNLLIDASGNLIVSGTNALNTGAGRGNITINGTAGSIINFTVNGADKGWIFHDNTNLTIQNTTANALLFNTNNNEKVRIRSDGMFEVKGAGTAGSSPAFSVNGSAPANSAVIDSSGRLLVGTSTSIAVLGVDSAIQVVGTGVDAFSSILRFSATAADCGGLIIGRSKSATKGTNTAVVQNDALGEINFAGTTNTTYHSAASISAFVDGEVGTSGDTTDMPGRLVFSTTADGSASPSERMRITSGGDVSIVTGNLIIGTAGKGIDFSATANSSGTMTNELLSDYEEGTWEPRIAGNDGAAFVGTTYTARSGLYRKIGSLVYVSYDIEVNVAGTLTGSATIGNLPFNVLSSGDLRNGGGSIGYITGIQQNYVYQSNYPQNNSSYLYIIGRTAASSTTALVSSSNFFANSMRITGQAWYSV